MNRVRALVCLAALGLASEVQAQAPAAPPTRDWLASVTSLWAAPQQPHPAVARIIVPERGGVAFGSGTLVDANDQWGLVVTNWHVVGEATGEILVQFPDGFRSPARVLKTDRDWDLAALQIRKPKVAPVSLATRPPTPGDVLTIAGYGSGTYRAASGRCTQYVAPGVNFPYEMVELSAGARQGDSGGPILNSSGQLAGVLFGESRGKTSGSYCGRVHRFLASLNPDRLTEPPPANTQIAAAPPDQNWAARGTMPGRGTVVIQQHPPVTSPGDSRLVPVQSRRPATTVAMQSNPASTFPSSPATNTPPAPMTNRFAPAPPEAPPPSAAASVPPMTDAQAVLAWAGATPFEQGKTCLAIFGALMLLVHGFRLLGKVH